MFRVAMCNLLVAACTYAINFLDEKPTISIVSGDGKYNVF